MNAEKVNISEEELTSLLNGLDDDIQVPLDASAAWRTAVRNEEKRTKRNRFVRSISSVAAAVIVLVGVTVLMRAGGYLNNRKTEYLEDSAPAGRIYYTVSENDIAGYKAVGVDASASIAATASPVIENDMEETAEVPVSGGNVLYTSAAAEVPTDDVSAAYAAVDELVNCFGGYRKNESKRMSASGEGVDLTVSIPVEALEAFGKELISIYPKASFVISVSDRSELYADGTERLNSLELIAERTNELIVTASGDELNDLYEKLNAVYDEMDALRADIRSAEGTDEADVFIAIVKSGKHTIGNGISNIIGNLKDGFLNDTCATFIVLLPAAIIIALLITIIARQKRNNRRK